MKGIIWTRHARDNQKARPLSDAVVERTARQPEWTEADPDPEVQRRFRVLPELGGRVLRVACAETEEHIRIVTFTLDRNARRKRRR